MNNIIVLMPPGTTALHPGFASFIAQKFGMSQLITEEFFFSTGSKQVNDNLIMATSHGANWAPFGKPMTLIDAMKEVGLLT